MLTLLSILLFNPLVWGQEIKTILRAPEDWNSEIISFPLDFAPQIDFTGFEDIRFAPGWADQNSDEFWTYHFTWFIEQKGAMTEDLLTEILTIYYDGLAQTVLTEQSDNSAPQTLNKTLCLFIKTEEGFRGKMRIFDSFFTMDYVILHVKVREFICEDSQKQMISFDVSPRSFHDEVWEIFEHVEIIEKCK